MVVKKMDDYMVGIRIMLTWDSLHIERVSNVSGCCITMMYLQVLDNSDKSWRSCVLNIINCFQLAVYYKQQSDCSIMHLIMQIISYVVISWTMVVVHNRDHPGIFQNSLIYHTPKPSFSLCFLDFQLLAKSAYFSILLLLLLLLACGQYNQV